MHVLTKTQVRQMYFLGLILSKFVSKSRIQSMVGKYQFNNQEMQKEISAIIEKDTILNAELTQLKDSDCDCENGNTAAWGFPILCVSLFIIYAETFFLWMTFGLNALEVVCFTLKELGNKLNCFWIDINP